MIIRNKIMDSMKGFGILLVIFGHCMIFENPLNRVIYSFHMPLFFILSGYVYNIKYKDLQKIYIIKKLKLFFYYFLLPSIIFTILTPVFFKLGFYSHAYTGIPVGYTWYTLFIHFLKSMLYLDILPLLVGQLWFVRNLVVILIVFNLFNKLFKTNILIKQAVVSLISFSIFLFLQSEGFQNLSVNLFLSYPFIYLGFLFKEKNTIDKLNNIFKIKYINYILMCSILIFMFLFGVLYPKNIIDFYSARVYSVFYFIIMCSLGMLLTYLNAKEFSNKFINFLGENSIKILVIHGLILKLISYTIKLINPNYIHLTEHYVQNMNYYMVFLYFIVCTIISSLLVYFYNHFKKVIISNIVN